MAIILITGSSPFEFTRDSILHNFQWQLPLGPIKIPIWPRQLSSLGIFRKKYNSVPFTCPQTPLGGFLEISRLKFSELKHQLDTSDNQSLSEEDQFRIKVLLYNKKGTEKLKMMDMTNSIKDLKQAEQMLVKKLKNMGNSPETLKLLAVTLNNIACYYKRSNKFHTALRYLARVLQIEKHVFNESVSLGATYLNIGAILSEMKKHFEA